MHVAICAGFGCKPAFAVCAALAYNRDAPLRFSLPVFFLARRKWQQRNMPN
jgi:hypothetical protein